MIILEAVNVALNDDHFMINQVTDKINIRQCKNVN